MIFSSRKAETDLTLCLSLLGLSIIGIAALAPKQRGKR